MAMTPSIWRDSDRDRAVSKRDAIVAWSEAAWPILQRVASSYGGYITFRELGRQLQDASGVRTTMQLEHWIFAALQPVTKRIQGDPSRAPLVSLVVGPDGGVGRDYANRGNASFRSADARLAAAAADRLECYRAFASDVPDDAYPKPIVIEPEARTSRSTRTAGAPRSSRAKLAGATSSTRVPAKSVPEREVAVCATCNLQLTPAGECDLCG